MAKEACKCKEVECEECPEWIFTLADLIMCMMGLFVILWVLKPGMAETPPPTAGQQASAESEQWLETVGDIRGGFGWVPDPSSQDPIDKIATAKRNRLSGRGEKGNSPLEKKGAEGTDQEVTKIREGKQAAVGGRLLFEIGDAALSPLATKALDEIAEQIRGHRNIVLVKGHTSLDDFADGATAEQKMALSVQRAQTVADALTARGVEPDIIRVQGCSSFEPVIQREYQPNAQSVNRRVEVEATATLVQERQDQSKLNGMPKLRNSPAAPTTSHE